MGSFEGLDSITSYGGRPPACTLSSNFEQSDDNPLRYTLFPSAPYLSARVLIASSAEWSNTREDEKSITMLFPSSLTLNNRENACVDPKKSGPLIRYALTSGRVGPKKSGAALVREWILGDKNVHYLPLGGISFVRPIVADIAVLCL